MDDDSASSQRPPHIADALDNSPVRRGRANSARPLPIPVSRYAARRPPSRQIHRWEPRCNHSNMIRLYHSTYKCDNCRRTGHFGWVYRCIMDREAILVGNKESGHRYAFDDLGHEFSEKMTLGKYGPDARSHTYNLFKEMTEGQLRSYTPAQLTRLLEQRDHVRETIAKERRGENELPFNLASQKYPDDERPWMPGAGHECQYKVCHACHNLGKEKSWVSFDGVLNGDILPTTATGFSFSHLGFRPVADASVVKKIGYRAVPMPADHRALRRQPSRTSVWRLMDIIEEHPELTTASNSTDSFTSTQSSDIEVVGLASPLSPHAESLRRISYQRLSSHQPQFSIEENATESPDRLASFAANYAFDESSTRPPWTPPPTPECEDIFSRTPTTDLSLEALAVNGRSQHSLKTNPATRDQVFATIPTSSDTATALDEHKGHGCCVNNTLFLPYTPEEMCDVGLFLRFNRDIFESAVNTPLPKATMEENLYFVTCNNEVEGSQDEDRSFSDKTCDIADGIALTEEAAESGMVDVVAHLPRASPGQTQ
ncbi:hypothetical protein OQA88_9254 [Cercophora sp. LCS_1]